ncbi:MAG: hypothetical protein U9Q33_06575 [Campylobacterota bacterium]|nr:hypothetical protein [Campylobacterota bacterium]
MINTNIAFKVEITDYSKLKRIDKIGESSPEYKYEIVDNPYTRELGKLSFEITRDNDLDPYSISYDDYQNLNPEALDELFVKGSQKYKDALSLMFLTSEDNDPMINKIMFDKYKETKGEGEELKLMQKALMTAIFFDPQKEDNYPLSSGQLLFERFEALKEDFKTSASGFHWADGTDKIAEGMDLIREEYEKRVSENKALLSEYTKNNRPNLLEQKEV